MKHSLWAGPIWTDQYMPARLKDGGVVCAAGEVSRAAPLSLRCDDCLRRLEAGEPWQDVIRWACRGYPATDGRLPVSELTGVQEHNMDYHEDET